MAYLGVLISLFYSQGTLTVLGFEKATRVSQGALCSACSAEIFHVSRKIMIERKGLQ